MKTNYMKRKITWLTLSSLMALSLVIAACSPAVVEKPKVTEKPKPEVTEKLEVVEPVVEKPKYGGVLRLFYWLGRLERFDQTIHIVVPPMQNTHETLLAGDWTKGPAGGYGTRETVWENRNEALWHLHTGALAESWEFPTRIEGDMGTMTFHIRRGVHWALNPNSEASRLVGGREMTTDDVIFSLKQAISSPKWYVYRSNPELLDSQITSPAPWTVKVEVPWEAFSPGQSRFGIGIFIVSPEVYNKYGDMTNWRNNVGTGPFMLTSYMPDSTITLVRNPNYWMKDPIGPGKGNQLPYLDEVKYFIIPDRSTQLAALRTGKIDWIDHVTAEEAVIMEKMTPQLIVRPKREVETGVGRASIKISQPPFNDIRVRRALYLATDFETIVGDYYDGRGRIGIYPHRGDVELLDVWHGPDPTTGEWPPDAPESVKELYIYNPEKAKQLLAEAGYPKGFKTNIILENTAERIDYFSIIKNMWAKVGIDLELRPMESAAFDRVRFVRSFDQLINASGGTGPLYRLYELRSAQFDNQSEIDDPVIEDLHAQMEANLLTNLPEAHRLVREIFKHAAEQAYGFPGVGQFGYIAWWPWLKNYSGELYTGFNRRHFNSWVWLDQELKKAMGY